MVPLLLPALPLYMVKRVSHCVLPGVPACREGEDVSGLSTPAPGESLLQSRGGFTLKFSCDVKPVDVKDVGGPLKHAA